MDILLREDLTSWRMDENSSANVEYSNSLSFFLDELPIYLFFALDHLLLFFYNDLSKVFDDAFDRTQFLVTIQKLYIPHSKEFTSRFVYKCDDSYTLKFNANALIFASKKRDYASKG